MGQSIRLLLVLVSVSWATLSVFLAMPTSFWIVLAYIFSDNLDIVWNNYQWLYSWVTIVPKMCHYIDWLVVFNFNILHLSLSLLNALESTPNISRIGSHSINFLYFFKCKHMTNHGPLQCSSEFSSIVLTF